MSNDLITMLAAGLFAAIVLYAARHATQKLLGVSLPKWVTPAAAGLAMILATVWGEYRWFADASARLPATAQVVSANAASEPWRPWTYLWPVTTRFVALDGANSLRPAPGVVATNLYLVARWQPVQPVTVAYDCVGHRQAVLGGEAAVNADGTLTSGVWMAAPEGDAGLNTACAGG
ncbi:hypothetical protein [Rhodobacter capsulatus]|uniref:hypothetical protein n=1 Tax=Rhodobacter capsulatus TaxID=1061 RepID=UPI004027B4EE